MSSSFELPTITITPPENDIVDLSREDEDIALFCDDFVEISDDEDGDVRQETPNQPSTPRDTPRPDDRQRDQDSPPDVYIDHSSVEHLGQTYRPGRDAELWDGSFIRILRIRENFLANGSVTWSFHGPRFERCRVHMGVLPKKLNELVMVAEEARVLLRDVRRRRQIILTNAVFPTHRPELNASESDIENQGRLVCRWKMSCPGTQSSRHLAPREKRHPYIYKGTVQRLLETEADEKFSVPDLTLRYTWRELWNHGPPPAASEGPPKKYTFGDAFCGGGGMSTGAHDAGFFNQWSFDRDEDAILTYRQRYPEAQACQLSVHDFLQEKTDFQVDVMHLSPPCQPHSPAHTTPGKNDEENEATGLAISPLLRKIRPRYATLEQTFGLVNRPEWFAAAIASFTSEGFSVKWDVLFCEQYGVPQTRKRLFILAACPGERLPDFPPQTHAYLKTPLQIQRGLPPGLQKARTLWDAISGINLADHPCTLHNPNDPLLRFADGSRTTKQTFDTPFLHTVMAGGSGDNVHPSGVRRYTLRELACIQTFPLDYQFTPFNKTAVKRLIGNAVPPVMAEALLKMVRKALQESDAAGDERSYTPPVSTDPASLNERVNEDLDMGDEVLCTGHIVHPPRPLNSPDDPYLIQEDEPEVIDVDGPVAIDEDEPITIDGDDEMEVLEEDAEMEVLAPLPPPFPVPSPPPLEFQTPSSAPQTLLPVFRTPTPPAPFIYISPTPSPMPETPPPEFPIRHRWLLRLSTPPRISNTPETAILIEEDEEDEEMEVMDLEMSEHMSEQMTEQMSELILIDDD